MTNDPSIANANQKALNAVKEHYAAIGQVAAEWASLEAEIDYHAIQLTKASTDLGMCLTSQIAGSARKLDAYIALAGLRGASEKTLKSWKVFASEVQGLSEQRNRVIHDPWEFTYGEGRPIRLELTARKKAVLEFVDHPTKEVEKLLASIAGLKERFSKMNESLMVEIGAWPGKRLRE